MKIAESRLTRQNQVSIPAEVRRRLGLQPGSYVDWEVEGDDVVIRRAGRHTSAAIHDVLFPTEPSHHSLDELKEGIRRHIKTKHAGR